MVLPPPAYVHILCVSVFLSDMEYSGTTESSGKQEYFLSMNHIQCFAVGLIFGDSFKICVKKESVVQ